MKFIIIRMSIKWKPSIMRFSALGIILPLENRWRNSRKTVEEIIQWRTESSVSNRMSFQARFNAYRAQLWMQSICQKDFKCDVSKSIAQKRFLKRLSTDKSGIIQLELTWLTQCTHSTLLWATRTDQSSTWWLQSIPEKTLYSKPNVLRQSPRLHSLMRESPYYPM